MELSAAEKNTTSLVCKMLIWLFGLAETNTIGYLWDFPPYPFLFSIVDLLYLAA